VSADGVRVSHRGFTEGKPTFFPFRVAVLCMGEYSTPEEVYEAFQAGESLDVEDIELLNEHPDMKSRASSVTTVVKVYRGV